MTKIPRNVLTINQNPQRKHSVPYLSIRDSLMKVPYIRKTVIRNLPKVCLPLYPVDYPMSAIVTCSNGKKAIINRIPVRNIKEPPFYSLSVKDLGATVNLEHFVCKTGYTITFDIQRKCRTCPTELGVYMSRLTCNKFAICITPEDICPRDNWGIRGEMVGKDLVHLTETGIKLLTEVTHRAILSFDYTPPPTPESRIDINCHTSEMCVVMILS